MGEHTELPEQARRILISATNLFMANGWKVRAIQAYRCATGADLHDAKAYVETLQVRPVEHVALQPEVDTELRDRFAAEIAGGMAAHSGTSGLSFGPGEIAGRAYEVADAMLAARQKGSGQ